MKKIVTIFLCLALCATMALPVCAAAEPTTTGTGADIPTFAPGDINGDYYINMKDILLLRKYIAQFEGIDAVPAMDMNGDNLINMKDVLALRKAVAEESVPFYSSSLSYKFPANLLKNTYKSGENLVVSPLSAKLALAMASEGAAGNTALQFAELINFDKRVVAADSPFANDPGSVLIDFGKTDGVTIANAAWLKDGVVFKDAFLDTLTEKYAAEKFVSQPDTDALAALNRWVSEKTNGKIEDLLDEIPTDTLALLVNALTFNSEWKRPFNPQLSEVKNGEFINADGSKSEVKMLCQELVGVAGPNSKGFTKEYANGYHFVALLPDEGKTVDDVIANLDAKELYLACATTALTKYDVSFPEFEISSTLDLNDALKAMGLTDAFDKDKANFSNMTDEQAFLSLVKQKATVSVTEKGTEAAAATEMVLKSAVSDWPTLEFNRPFVYVIASQDNVPVFIGVANQLG